MVNISQNLKYMTNVKMNILLKSNYKNVKILNKKCIIRKYILNIKFKMTEELF